VEAAVPVLAQVVFRAAAAPARGASDRAAAAGRVRRVEAFGMPAPAQAQREPADRGLGRAGEPVSVVLDQVLVVDPVRVQGLVPAAVVAQVSAVVPAPE
jgi:hypothetical protein